MSSGNFEYHTMKFNHLLKKDQTEHYTVKIILIQRVKKIIFFTHYASHSDPGAEG